MSFQLITVNLLNLIEKTRTFTITIDNDYTVLDFITYLKNYENQLGLYSLSLPDSGLISPANLQDKIIPQVNKSNLDIKIPEEIDESQIDPLAEDDNLEDMIASNINEE